MAVLKPRRVETEDYYYEALAFSRRSINLERDEENMRPEKSALTPRISGINPSTMKMKRWYPEQDRASDLTSLTGLDRPSYRAREQIEDDEERLAMRQGDLPPPIPEPVVDPRIREDRTVQDLQRNSGKMHRATHEDAYARAWFDYCRSVFPQSVRKAGSDVDLYNVSTYQCSILFNNMGSFKPFLPQEKFNISDDPQLSPLREFWGNNYAHVILTAEADSLPKDEKACLMTMVWWDVIQAELVSPCQN